MSMHVHPENKRPQPRRFSVTSSVLLAIGALILGGVFVGTIADRVLVETVQRYDNEIAVRDAEIEVRDAYIDDLVDRIEECETKTESLEDAMEALVGAFTAFAEGDRERAELYVWDAESAHQDAGAVEC